MKCFIKGILLFTSLVCLAELYPSIDAHSILPENNLYLEDQYAITGEAPNGMTQEIFNTTIEKIENFYKPIVKQSGGNLRIVRDWPNSTVNAYAKKNGSSWLIMAYGGMARRQELTIDGYVIVLCHEMGHLIGGSPKMSGMSLEGQSDYWGASVCAKNILRDRDLDNLSILQRNLPVEVEGACADKYKSSEDFTTCLKINEASFGLSNLFAVLQKVSTPSFLTPDKTIVPKMLTSHPKPQCRLDTFYAGSLGNPRPLCWFKP